MKLDTPEKIIEFLSKNPKSSFISEDGKYYSLENGQLTIIEPNYYHSLEYVKKVRHDLTVKYKDYPGTMEIEETWELLNQHYNGLVERDTNYASSPIGTMAELWVFGFYPPPEIMTSIVTAYNHYLTLGGVVSLEEVFFGKSKKSTGNYARKRSRESEVQMLHFLISCDKRNSSHVSNLERACEVADMYKLKKDPESLLRKYRRYLKGR